MAEHNIVVFGGDHCGPEVRHPSPDRWGASVRDRACSLQKLHTVHSSHITVQY